MIGQCSELACAPFDFASCSPCAVPSPYSFPLIVRPKDVELTGTQSPHSDPTQGPPPWVPPEAMPVRTSTTRGRCAIVEPTAEPECWTRVLQCVLSAQPAGSVGRAGACKPGVLPGTGPHSNATAAA